MGITEDPRDTKDNEAWAGFRERLAIRLAGMKPGHYLLLEVAELHAQLPEIPGYYLQFGCDVEERLLAEAVSGRNLPEQWALSTDASDALHRFGWSAPTEGLDLRGPGNVCHSWPAPPPFGEIADLAVSTLRQVYGVTAVTQLAYRHFDKTGGDFELEDLGPRFEREHLLREIALEPDGTITGARAAVGQGGELEVNESVRDGMFTSLHDRWTLSPAAKDEILLRLISDRFRSGESLVAWVQSLNVPFRHASDYSGPTLQRR